MYSFHFDLISCFGKAKKKKNDAQISRLTQNRKTKTVTTTNSSVIRNSLIKKMYQIESVCRHIQLYFNDSRKKNNKKKKQMPFCKVSHRK